MSCNTLSLCAGILTFEEDDETNLTSTIAGPKSQTQVTDWKAVTKDGLGVASRFLLTLLKRLPECVDGNPVKVAFSVAKVIIDVANVCVIVSVSWSQVDY